MKNRLLLMFLLGTTLGLGAAAPKPAGPAATPAVITALLQEFLARAEEPAMHDRFWAADLVYTASSGKVQTKGDIMQSFAALPAAPAPSQTHSL